MKLMIMLVEEQAMEQKRKIDEALQQAEGN